MTLYNCNQEYVRRTVHTYPQPERGFFEYGYDTTSKPIIFYPIHKNGSVHKEGGARSSYD
jgi:hypothetical protein